MIYFCFNDVFAPFSGIYCFFLARTADSARSEFDDSTLNGASPVPSLAVTEGDYGAPSSSRMDSSRSTLIE